MQRRNFLLGLGWMAMLGWCWGQSGPEQMASLLLGDRVEQVPPETLADLRRIFVYAFDGRTIPKGYFHPDPREVTGPFQVGDLEISAFRLPHGRMQTLGYLFRQNGHRRLAYLSDCREIPDAAIPELRGTDVVILDALRKQPHPTHMCLDEALTAARRLGAERSYLTHLTHDYDHDVDQAELPGGVFLAYDGLKVDVS